jgi:hypothetical protein
MNGWLMVAAALCVLIALVHSVLGEWRIFRHLRRGHRLVPTEGGTVLREFQLRIVWGTWHGLSVMGLGLAAVLAWLAASPDARAASGGVVEASVAAALATTGLVVLVSNRGRHPAWLALLVVAALVGIGSMGS